MKLRKELKVTTNIRPVYLYPMLEELSPGTQLTGTACMYGSAEVATDRRGIYTPNQLHYPDETVIGKGIVNPIGMIAAAALMLRYSFGLEQEAKAIEAAIEAALYDGYGTIDIVLPGRSTLSTMEMTEVIRERIGCYL